MIGMALWLTVLLVGVIRLASAGADGGVPQIKGSKKSKLEALPGADVVIRCPVEQSPNLIIEWYKDGSFVDAVLNLFKMGRKGSLTIFNVTVEDSGTYVCKAINGFGTAEVSVSLVIQGAKSHNSHGINGAKPVFSCPKCHSQTVFPQLISSSIKFNCSATGDPSPDIHWFKDGQELKFDEIPGPVKRSRWVLHFNKLQKEHSGTYMCEVRNEFGVINATFVLNVIGPGPNKPKLDGLHPLNTTVECGETASFQCRVQSEDFPRILWLKKLEEITTQVETIEFEGNYFKVLKSSEVVESSEGLYLNKLTLSEVSGAESGVYICVAANSMGYNHKEAFLKVQPCSNGIDLNYESPGMGSFSLTLVITVPLIVIVVVLIVLIMHCRGKNFPAVNQNKTATNKPPALNNSAHSVHQPPMTAAVFPSNCGHNAVAMPPMNVNCQPQWANVPSSMVLPNTSSSSWSSQQQQQQQQQQQHHRRSGAATPNSSAGETRSGTSTNLPKVHYHHHQHRYHHQC